MRGLSPTPLAGRGSHPLSSVFDLRVRWSRIDWPIPILAGLLLATGIVFLGAMSDTNDLFARDDVSLPGHLKKVVVSIPVLFLAFVLRPRFLRRHAVGIYGACLVLLALVPIIGDVRNNARRWIQLPMGFDLQPSELAKLGLILLLAHLLYRRRMRTAEEWFAPSVAALVPMAMVVAQPDLGTAMTIVPVTLGMFYLAGARGSTIAILCVLIAALGWATWRFELVQDYQLKRIQTWAQTFDAEDLIDQKKRGAFHAYHARVAIGNGGLRGRGLGMGVANRAANLPERDADSIFAVVAEEGGWVFATAVIAFYLLLVLLLLAAAASIRERFARLAVAGIALYFAAHFTINIAVNVGLLPMTGLTLPLLSTGGSSMLTCFAALGIALGLSARHEATLDEDAFRF